MTETRKLKPQTLSGFVLFAVILIVSVVIAVLTEMDPFARGGIAVVCGIVAAATSFILLERHQKRSEK